MRILLKILVLLTLLVVLLTFMIKHLHPAIGREPALETVRRAAAYDPDTERFVNQIATKSADFSQMPNIVRRYWNRNVEKAPVGDYFFGESNRAALADTGFQVNWLGHAAVLIHYQGRYLLADPMLGARASPFTFAGPQRYAPPPLAAADLPPLDAVIISHDHYDHLDYETIRAIKDRVKKFYVPVGVGASLRHWGVPTDRIAELDWWEGQTDGDVEIVSLPARHFSGRYLTQNNTLWASWLIRLGDHKIYFGGDSGIFDGFAEIGERYGPFDLSLLPIGAYDPAWHDIHLNPEEAVEAFQMLGGGALLPIHWGTFDLALHAWHEPIDRLLAAAADSVPLLTPPPGRWAAVADATDPRWWAAFQGE